MFLAVIFIGILLCSLIVISILVPTGNGCTGFDKNIYFFPNDTVMAGSFSFCQNHPKLYNISMPNSAQAFAVNCKILFARNEVYDPECTNSNNLIRVLLDSKSCSHSNYFLTGSSIKLDLDPLQESDLYACFFTDANSFNGFKKTTNETELPEVIKSAEECEKFYSDNGSNNSVKSHTTLYVTPKNGYLFGGVIAKTIQPIDHLNYNITVNREYYDENDYTDDKISCFENETECKITKNYSNTCLLIYAYHNESISDNFNVVRVTAQYNFGNWRFILTLSTCAFLFSLIISVSVMTCMYISCS